ncbi:hypothetical protein CVT24_008193 [Panaeolus cyanescens]|uniref:AAA+ ATPase domain-containing protein n=1 Tax=Panaeolus cyanescens TaxID=181874 RepID=A0A409W0D9_9AGAR|nr:hypothetical protein CVT24_008193 [Panaeolus cyanescens]
MSAHSLLWGPLRVSALKGVRFNPTLSLHNRFYSLSSTRQLRTPLQLILLSRQRPLTHSNRRLLSLGSIFGSSKPVPTPSPQVVAHITKLEAEANVHMHDVAKQLALYEALLDTRLKSSYELVVNRWDKMVEFDPSSPLLKSEEAFKVYLTCLQNLNQPTAINAAVEKRDALLATQAVGQATSPEQPNGQQVAPESVEASSFASTPVEQTPSVQTSSQRIAHQVTSHATSPSINHPSVAAKTAKPFASSGDNGSDPIQVSIVERKGAWIPRLVRFVVLVIVSSFFFLVILSVFFENTGFMKAGPRQSQFEPSEGKTVTFSDVHGVDEAKEELQDVVAFLKDPTAFASLGGKLPKGVLLTGPPGTGKTLLARAVAGEAGVPFFFASGSDFEEMFVGVGAKRVRELFAAARKKEPAIIFIDELDAVGGKRSSRDQQYMKQTLNQLLVEMDGFQQSEGVIVIAATNFPESLDQALVRPGRFDRVIAVPLPDIRGRVQILQHHLRDITVNKGIVLARGTPGFSGADLQNMVNQAAIHASKLRAKEVNLDHFEWAKDRIVMGAERKSHYQEYKTKLATAYHEGGHALVALYTDGAMPLHKVTCVPRGHALGYTSLLPENDRTSVSFKEYLAEIDVSMGGRVAEELSKYYNYLFSPHRTHLHVFQYTERITSQAAPVLTYATQQERQQGCLVRGGEARATALLTAKLEELHRLARALVEHETLDLEEVKKVVKGEPIRTINEVLQEAADATNPEPQSPPSTS